MMVIENDEWLWKQLKKKEKEKKNGSAFVAFSLHSVRWEAFNAAFLRVSGKAPRKRKVKCEILERRGHIL